MKILTACVVLAALACRRVHGQDLYDLFAGELFIDDISLRTVCDGAAAGDHDCLSCQTPVECNADGSYSILNTCGAGEGCTVLEGSSSSCLPHGQTEQCSCTVPRQCDPYNNTLVMICNQNGPLFSEPCAAGETCQDGQCGVVVTETTAAAFDCTGLPDGWNLEPPECQNGFYCSGGTSLGEYECTEGQYFDPDLGCHALPVDSCEGCPAGRCPDKLDCLGFYVCDGNGNVLDYETCVSGCFNPTLAVPACDSTCDPATVDYCPPTSVCTGLVGPTMPIESTTAAGVDTTTADSGVDTTTSGGDGGDTTTAASVECSQETEGNYPHETDCKKYYRCMQVAPGQWDVVERTCLENLVFNPETGLCDYPENVPDCVPALNFIR